MVNMTIQPMEHNENRLRIRHILRFVLSVRAELESLLTLVDLEGQPPLLLKFALALWVVFAVFLVLEGLFYAAHFLLVGELAVGGVVWVGMYGVGVGLHCRY